MNCCFHVGRDPHLVGFEVLGVVAELARKLIAEAALGHVDIAEDRRREVELEVLAI